MNIDAAITFFGMIALIGFFALVAIGGSNGMGCYLIGSEVNGNNTVEYMRLGACY